MTNTVIIVGESIKYNEILKDYLYRNIKKHLQQIDFLYLLEENDKNLFLTLEEAVSKSDNTIIVSNDKNFNIIGKILCTIFNDTMIVKSNMIIPSKSILYDDNSYLLEESEKKINVFQAKENNELPKILINGKKDIKFINIFYIDEESCKILLKPIAENYEIKIKIIKIIEEWNLVKIESLKYGQINNFIESARQLLNNKIIPEKDICKFITKTLINQNQKITTAESCTGGLLSSMFIKYSGVSSIINGNLVTYSNQIKEAWLGVEQKTLQTYGAVSEECVKEMLEGALNISNCEIAIAISGIAGPIGGTEEKPVGTVYIGVKSINEKEVIQKLHLNGDRIYIQKQAAYYAIKLLLSVKKNIFF